MATSTALVVCRSTGQVALVVLNTTAVRSDPIRATQVLIATSNPVLAGAIPCPSSYVTQGAPRLCRDRNPHPNILSISAKGKTAAEAVATANVVAKSYIAICGSPGKMPAAPVPAQMLQSAVNATGPAT